MTSTFLGLAVALAGFFCIVAAALMGLFPVLEGFRWHAVGCLGLASVSLAVAWFRSARAAQIELQDSATRHRATLLRAWSIMLAVLGTISIFLQPLGPFGKTAKPVVAIATAPRPAPTPPPAPVVPPKPPAPVKFRELKIQGILFQTNKRLVIIEGNAYGAGETIYDIRIKSVQRNSVTLEKDGVEKVIPYNG
jgi:hypothetical protein